MSQLERAGWHCRGYNHWRGNTDQVYIAWVDLTTDWSVETVHIPNPAERTVFSLGLALLGFQVFFDYLGEVRT